MGMTQNTIYENLLILKSNIEKIKETSLDQIEQKRIDAYNEASTLDEYEFIELCSNVEKEEVIQFLNSQELCTKKRP